MSKLDSFVSKIPDFVSLKPLEQIDYFIYYLLTVEDLDGVSPKKVEECFHELYLKPYSNISSALNRYSSRNNDYTDKFVKKGSRYFLQRKRFQEIKQELDGKEIHIKTANKLRDLLDLVPDPEENSFLEEAIDCFEIEAWRAAVIMTWNLTVNHLYEYILKHELTNFNTAITKKKLKKPSKITTKDDFTEMKESTFIELCRSSFITNDVRKILDTKLGIRNTCAHPSTVTITETKAIDFIEDLVTNVILKYLI